MDELLPRPNNQPPISIRKSAFGRTNLFLPTSSTVFREVRCSASTMARQATASIYHAHSSNEVGDVSEQLKQSVCWHCCHPFETDGFRLPRSYDPSERTYQVFGWFCSANCCKAYILEHSTFDRGYQMNIFVRMLREVYGIQDTIVEAPPRISLKLFGGPFDIESFRTQKNVCFIVHPPFISYSMLIEERQPMQALGETSGSTSTLGAARGSVRGLRRPTVGVNPIHDCFATPSNTGTYMQFLETHKGEGSSDMEHASKKMRKDKKDETATTSAKGLGRFVK